MVVPIIQFLLNKTIELGHDVSLVFLKVLLKHVEEKLLRHLFINVVKKKILNTYSPDRFSDSVTKKIMSSNYDLGIIYAYGKLVPISLIEHCKYGIMNLHCSLLPRYRGAAPIQHALINGEEYTGYTFFRINEKLDEGILYFKKDTQILESDNCSSIQDSLTELAVNNLSVAINRLIQGEFLDSDQPDEISYANKIQKEDSIFYWV